MKYKAICGNAVNFLVAYTHTMNF